LGTALRFEISAGQAQDSRYAIPILKGLKAARNVLADMAHGADYIRRSIADDLKANAVAPRHPARAITIPMEKGIYKERHFSERFFNEIKRFRRIALRCEKAISSVKAFVAIACAMVWLR